MKQERQIVSPRRLAVTLLELMVVVLIIGILASVATGIYTNQTRRARIAATIDLINTLEVGIARYELDMGTYPPSGSARDFPPSEITAGGRRDGSGLLYLALTRSLSGNTYAPGSPLWGGPYIQMHNETVADSTKTEVPGSFDILDSWGNPIFYVQWRDYEYTSADFNGGTRLFTFPVPGQNPNLPAPHPHYERGETYYNPTTYQLYSLGPDGQTLGFTVMDQVRSYRGAAEDDINNFGI